MKTIKTAYNEIEPYITKDGSIVRELMHPASHGTRGQSLAEAIVPSGGATLLHKHRRSEELYHVTQGEGLMTLGSEAFEVRKGDTVCILPGVAHQIRNTSGEPLHILCCCSPAYSHDDTELVSR